MSDIPLETWLLEISKLQEAVAEGAVLIQDIADRIGHSPMWVRRRLAKCAARGQIRITPVRVDRLCLDGCVRKVPAYKVEVL